MSVAAVLRELHAHEQELAHRLLRVSERHRPEPEIHHLARDLAGWSRRHLVEIAGTGRRFGLDLDPDPAVEPGLAARLREKGGELAGRRPEPGLLLLHDLRGVHVQAAEVSVDWVMIAQAAQASRDGDLLALTDRCHPDTLRQMRWANAHVKVLSPQILLST
ncbi:hypothetical protein [Actinomadura macrotermitis]|uniref:Uncharacterized protein n=1 Tax=Actinomadura macrotermitis TaxID=2585200 RepID=A0A7K0C4Y2_9ACTN|nr:hypothetical protein [Actinomadura macrotermitis]MQY07884.1 hypothetical protein [Actinomadura macrotermitis]